MDETYWDEPRRRSVPCALLGPSEHRVSRPSLGEGVRSGWTGARAGGFAGGSRGSRLLTKGAGLTMEYLYVGTCTIDYEQV